MISGIMKTEIIGESFSLIFESGHTSSSKAVAAIQRFKNLNAFPKMDSFSFAKKADNVLVQASDILAWQLTKNIKDKAFSNRKPRKDFLRLFSQKHFVMYAFQDGDDFSIMCDKVPGKINAQRDQQIREIFNKEEFRDKDLVNAYEVARQSEPGSIICKPGTLRDGRITEPPV